jgi:hypothetical protein
MVAHHPQRDPVGQAGVAVNEFGVGVEIPLLGTPDKVGVINTGLHDGPLVDPQGYGRA